MKTFSTLLLLAVAMPVFAQPADAPTVEHGLSVHLDQGQLVPFDGQLIDGQEQVRREKINERNAVELEDLKSSGNVTMTKPIFISIVAGGAVAAIVAAVAIGFLVQKK